MKHLFFVFFLYSLLSLFLVSCASSSIKEQRTLYKKGKIVESQAMAIQLLSESNPETKLQALRFLGKTKAIQAGKQVTTLFNDSNIEVQNQAMITAGKLQYVSASPLLLQGLFTKKESQQPSIIKSYQLMGTKGILPLVAAWEQTKDPVKKKKLQLVLHQLGIPAIKALALSFQNHTVFENKAKIDLIASFHSPTTGGILLELLGNKEITPSIVASLKALGSYAINPILASLQKLSIAKENIEQAKIEQGQLIVILGTKGILPLVAAWEQTKDPVKKKKLQLVLHQLGIPAIKALALSFQNHTVFENKAKIDLIACFHSPTTGGILLELLGNKEITPSIVASLKALGSYAINPILASLQKLSIAKENIEQAKIEQGQLIVILGKLRSSKAIPLLEKYTASDDIILKSRATQALRSIRGY